MELQELLAKAKALPSIPRVVSEVLTELNKEDPDSRKISEAVGSDPGLTARMLKLANSAFFGLSREIDSVSEAISILGFNHVRTLVQAVALSSSFKTVPGVNLEQFIRHNAKKAEIRLTMSNEGDHAYKPERFGFAVAFCPWLLVNSEPLYPLLAEERGFNEAQQ